MTKKKMTCKKCGCSLQADWKICPVCSFSAVKAEETIPQENMPSSKTPENNSQNYSGNEKLFIFVFLLSLSIAIITSPIITSPIYPGQVRGITFVAAAVSSIIGFIKYPNNKKLTRMFWLFWILILPLWLVFLRAE